MAAPAAGSGSVVRAVDWLLERDDSPWYPSVRLVRRQKGDAADVVMNRLADDLGQLAQ